MVTARPSRPGTRRRRVRQVTNTPTLAAGIVIQEEGRAGAREMLVGILGCNLAWGLIDGVLQLRPGLRHRFDVRMPAVVSGARIVTQA